MKKKLNKQCKIKKCSFKQYLKQCTILKMCSIAVDSSEKEDWKFKTEYHNLDVRIASDGSYQWMWVKTFSMSDIAVKCWYLVLKTAVDIFNLSCKHVNELLTDWNNYHECYLYWSKSY